jgi:hypothetical protein
MPCACNDIPDPSEAAQTADQYRVLFVLPLKSPISRIQDNKQDGNGGVDVVGEGVRGREGEVVLGCEGELVDELDGGGADASCGLHGEGKEVRVLSGGELVVVGDLDSSGLGGDSEKDFRRRMPSGPWNSRDVTGPLYL